MAEVRVAKSAGFCYGVERAVKLAEETAREKGGCAMLAKSQHSTLNIQHSKKMKANTWKTKVFKKQ